MAWISLQLSDDLTEKLNSKATTLGVSKADVVRLALRQMPETVRL